MVRHRNLDLQSCDRQYSRTRRSPFSNGLGDQHGDGTHRSLVHLQLDHIDITIFLEPGAGARHGVGQRSGSKGRSEGVRVTTDASMTYV